MTDLSTRQQASRSGHARRIKDPKAQQRILQEIGVFVPLSTLEKLPTGAWVEFASGAERPDKMS